MGLVGRAVPWGPMGGQIMQMCRIGGKAVIIIMELCTSSESLVVLLRGFSRFVLEFLPPYFERLLPALKSPRSRLLRSCGGRDFSRAS